MSNPIFEIALEEPTGINRHLEPVMFGVPFPKGLMMDSSGLKVLDEEDNFILTATTPLARWPDNSIKWLLFDCQLSVAADGNKRLKVYDGQSALEIKDCEKESFCPLEFDEHPGKIFIRSGEIEFEINSRFLLPFNQIYLNGQSQLLEKASAILLTDDQKQTWTPRVESWHIESQTALRLILAFRGAFICGDVVHGLRFKCRIHFFGGKATTKIDFTIWNPNAAQHPKGVWDLGDSGSIFFKDLSINFATNFNDKRSKIIYKLTNGPSAMSHELNCQDNFVIYQDSSGGENWRSRNHTNRHGKIPLTFRGYEVRKGQDVISRGNRATPLISLSNGDFFIATSVKHFWQNFPKAIETETGKLNIRLFPKYFKDLFELQGGEQKTHTTYLCLGKEPFQKQVLDWIHGPLIPNIAPEWYYSTGACPRPVPFSAVSQDEYYLAYQQLIDIAIHSELPFFLRREITDEYGWRNFGDIYADHEAVFHKGEEAFVSHYNNQYDVIKGAIIQFMRTGERSWFQLTHELANHVSDIDIYRTDQDRYQYNNGMFWHTDHHLDAATSTHRAFSKKHHEFKDPRFVGGGPALAHNYATGFLYNYWLTGDQASKEAVLKLADYVIHNLEGPDTVAEILTTALKTALKWLRARTKPKLIVYHEYFELSGPSRSSGNALNTLLDAFLICKDEKYFNWAEELIRCCVSPDDNIEAMDLLDAETRWMYVIFLQALGRYLDVKRELSQLDHSFWYARSALLHYAQWMMNHEYPYLKKPEILEFPDVTWAAQDIRKSDVLAHAALYAPKTLRKSFLEKSRFFFEICMDQLKNFDTRNLTRPVVILMTNGMVHMNAFAHLVGDEHVTTKDLDYGFPGVDTRTKRNYVLDIFARLLKVITKTSFSKELQWINQRIRDRI